MISIINRKDNFTLPRQKKCIHCNNTYEYKCSDVKYIRYFNEDKINIYQCAFCNNYIEDINKIY